MAEENGVLACRSSEEHFHQGKPPHYPLELERRVIAVLDPQFERMNPVRFQANAHRSRITDPTHQATARQDDLFVLAFFEGRRQLEGAVEEWLPGLQHQLVQRRGLHRQGNHVGRESLFGLGLGHLKGTPLEGGCRLQKIRPLPGVAVHDPQIGEVGASLRHALGCHTEAHQPFRRRICRQTLTVGVAPRVDHRSRTHSKGQGWRRVEINVGSQRPEPHLGQRIRVVQLPGHPSRIAFHPAEEVWD